MYNTLRQFESRPQGLRAALFPRAGDPEGLCPHRLSTLLWRVTGREEKQQPAADRRSPTPPTCFLAGHRACHEDLQPAAEAGHCSLLPRDLGSTSGHLLPRLVSCPFPPPLSQQN